MTYKELLAWSLSSWSTRHNRGYFPKSNEHKNWKVYQYPPAALVRHVCPTHSDSALEIGCGYGEWMIPLSYYVKSVDGFDIHIEPLTKALELFLSHNIKNCNVKLGTGDTIPYTQQFSLIYSISVFQHLPKAITRKYLEDSVPHMSDRCFHHFRSPHAAGFPKPEQDITINHTGDFSCGWSPDEIHEAAESAGLHNIQVIEDNAFNYLVATI